MLDRGLGVTKMMCSRTNLASDTPDVDSPSDELNPENFTWASFTDEELDEVFPRPPSTLAELIEDRPWLMDTSKGYVAGGAGATNAGPGSADLRSEEDQSGTRATRADIGKVRARTRKRFAAPPHAISLCRIQSDQHPDSDEVDAVHPAPYPLDVSIPPAYLPAGLLEALPPYKSDRYRACALDIVNQLAANEGDTWRALSCEDGRLRYGLAHRQPERKARGECERPFVWDDVKTHLAWLGIIEHRKTDDGKPYCIGSA